jgi:hypothetical protein
MVLWSSVPLIPLRIETFSIVLCKERFGSKRKTTPASASDRKRMNEVKRLDSRR